MEGEREGEKRKKKKKKKEKEAKIGGLTVPCLQTPRVLIATHCQGQWTILSLPVYQNPVIVKPSNRIAKKAISKRSLSFLEKRCSSFDRIQGISTIFDSTRIFALLSVSFSLSLSFLFLPLFSGRKSISRRNVSPS